MRELSKRFNLSKEAVILAFLVGLATAFLLAGYEYVRSPVNTLFKFYYGKESLPYMLLAAPVGLMVMLYFYGRILTLLGPKWTLLCTSLMSASAIAAGWWGLRGGRGEMSIFLFIVRSGYVVLLIEQYWSLLNSSLKQHEAKVLNGPICGIGSLGAIAGGLSGQKLTLMFGTEEMLLVAAGLTIPAACCTHFAYHFIEIRGQNPERFSRNLSHGPSDTLGVRRILANPTLLSLIIVVLMSQAIAASLGLSFQGILQDTIPDVDKQTAYSFGFYSAVNGASGVGQFLIAPVLLSYVAIGTVHRIMPLIHLGLISWAIVQPSLTSIGTVFLVYKAVDYSVFRAAKELLYIPLDFSSRFRAKEFIDVLGYRLGKGLTAGSFSAATALGFAITDGGYAVVALVAAGVWFYRSRYLGLD